MNFATALMKSRNTEGACQRLEECGALTMTSATTLMTSRNTQGPLQQPIMRFIRRNQKQGQKPK
jgi:hypothetical protein